ncbi:HAMP domain-containing sensor histidine kinase [Variovorax sp. PCZ-1]|uniref:sensor histidine kinase n=1 Tax=Variovorax sp. PCZ-1 TaxID=2835533 RepID=UPI001BCDE379|nr:HAMP domain-containing sensor histidine kinase [Variovorax sp. PCZ-1]MBS7809164.1 HAMP domain-containing histidine kinase [Variovorax sp. PCZ-1]
MMHFTWKQLKDWIVTPELEVILHPSRRRLQWLGVLTVGGHFLFWWLWTSVFPQPYEDWRWRLLMASTGLPLIFQPKGSLAHSRSMKWYFTFACWIQLPFFFVWMYFMNVNSAMWMATVAVMIVVYNNLTDWRLATVGLALGALASIVLAQSILGYWPPIPPEHWLVFSFSWVFASLLAFSSANLRRERLRQSLTVIGIMAHELRTPLATMALIAQAIRIESIAKDHRHEARLEELATRMEALSRTINHHIDLQMANARYTFLPASDELISARQLVTKVIEDYPFGSRRERQCVQIVLHADFCFHGSSRQFTQVLNNLIKNAMHSLKVAQSRHEAGDLRIELGMRGSVGRIQITDKGIGINASQLKLIFEPFFSTANETGHGLGLAFCKQVVEASHGTIMVASEPAMGATFTLQLPCQPAPSQENSHHEVSPLSPA